METNCFDSQEDSIQSNDLAWQVLPSLNWHLPVENLAFGKFPTISALETVLRANHTATSTLNHSSDGDKNLEYFQSKLFHHTLHAKSFFHLQFLQRATELL